MTKGTGKQMKAYVLIETAPGKTKAVKKELGPVVALLRAYRGGTLDWAEYRRRYLAGLERPEAQEAVAHVRGLAHKGTVTLLCGCPDEARCHRSLLGKYLLD